MTSTTQTPTPLPKLSKWAKETDSKRIVAVQVYRTKYTASAAVGSGGGGTSTTSKSNSTAAAKTTTQKNATTSSSKKKKRRPWQIQWYNLLFLALYMYQGTCVLRSMGEPYRQFLEKAEREGFAVMQGTTRYRAELEFAMTDINNSNRRTSKIGWFDWMDMDIEELAAEKKRDKYQSVLDSLPKSMRVPTQYQTSFWPTLILGIMTVIHALLLLLQHWSVSFNVAINYREIIDIDTVLASLPEQFFELDLQSEEEGGGEAGDSNDATEGGTSANGGSAATSGGPHNKLQKNERGERIVFPDREILNGIPVSLPTHARIIPAKGRHILLPIAYYPVLGMTFEYHRRRYYYNTTTQTWCKIRCRTALPLSFLQSWQGFPASLQLVAGQIRFGPNMFQVKQPTFMELYQKQLLNPFSVFQIFCVLLWAIDDYIVYSLFSLFMVLVFEGTVVFQRIKSLQALTTMGNPSRNVYVYRSHHWSTIDSAELLPGDIMSLTRIAPRRRRETKKKDDSAITTKKSPLLDVIEETKEGDVVPADLLLLRGSTVVNEASLTGESVPQMKEGLIFDNNTDNNNTDEEELLSMKLKHKMNVVYAGTKMLQCKGVDVDDHSTTSAAGTADGDITENDNDDKSSRRNSSSNIPAPPDHGCVCFVLRTGFASAQGKLVRMIEGSQEKVKGHERETGLLLLLLCVFALLSSSYVLYHGIQNENRSKYELLLHCIMIVTNVIRPELPMQMAMAVNNSLMTLMKLHIFCTEPYRVPVAGKLNACLFDKTGTLTTDELVAVGVCEPSKLNLGKEKLETDDTFLTPMSKLSGSEAALVLAGCHSLVVYDDETTGDPLESAALRSMRWQINGSTGDAEAAPARGDKIPAGKPLSVDGGTTISSIHIRTRHHFSSKLQRMSCVIAAGGKKYCVAKGSPEAIGKLLAAKPPGFDEKADYLSKQGYRVIGLAYRTLQSEADAHKAIETRSYCESELVFAGFIAFTCMVRKDTATVLKRLKEGGMSVTMVTGDALLTAIHVAKEVCIFTPLGDEDDLLDTIENSELREFVEAKRAKEGRPPKPKVSHHEFKPIIYLDVSDDGGQLFWSRYDDGTRVESYAAVSIPRLAEQYELAVTGKCLEQAYEDDHDTGKYLQHIRVFARMSPVAKETVIESLHSIGLLCLMCGDGANDVGALKQADVGVALLTGFANINVAKPDEGEKKMEEKKDALPTAIMSREHLEAVRALPVSLIKMKIRQLGMDPTKYPEIVEKEDLIKLYQIAARQAAIKRHEENNALVEKKKTKEELAAENQAQLAEMQQKMLRRTQELEAQGVSFASFKAMREVFNEQWQAKKNEAKQTGGVEGSAAALAAQFDPAASQLDSVAQGGLPMIKLGDASIAAPFTSRMPSIRNCVDIVRQGRCTLVSSMQMYQIMALQCLISSYSLSVLYLDGVKYGDSQMTAMGLLGSVSFLSVSRSKPLDKLSKVQPLSSIFHPALFISLLGQFAIHLTTMIVAVQSAKSHLPPDYTPELDGQFSPGILNTVVFLVSSVQQVTVFFVNIQGRPFMTGISENRPLLWSLAGTFILVFMFASESVPKMNRYFQLVPFPNDEFRNFILTILVLDLMGTFIFDRLMKFIFARDILRAAFQGTRTQDIWVLVRTFAIIGFLMYQFLGTDEQWEELIKMEEAMKNGTTADAVATDNMTDVFGGDNVIVNATHECLDGVCKAIQDVVVQSIMSSPMDDEF